MGSAIRHFRWFGGLMIACAALAGAGRPALAQRYMSGLVGAEPPTSKSAPVTFLADNVRYDRRKDLIIATGHVQAWQNGYVLSAHKVVIDRKDDTATAIGNVVLIAPSGQVVFAKRAKLSHGMRDAVMHGIATLLAENGRMVANGVRRYGGIINEIAKPIYSACDLCKSNPTAPPLWQIRARSAVENLQKKIIEYHDAELQIHGVPVLWLPYLSQPDPSVKRQSGLLIPEFGSSTHIGTFFAIPYFWVISKSQDMTIVPIIATKAGPVLDLKYRQAFNFGKLNINVSGGHDRYANARAFSDAIFSSGEFDLNKTWRAGFNYNHTSNAQYLDDFRYLPNSGFLASEGYLEGFGSGSYARIDAQTFQGLVATVSQNRLPIVAPYARYDYFGAPDNWGGRITLAANAFSIFRNDGTDSRRLAVTGGYDLPLTTANGVLINTRLRLIAAGYMADKLNEQPNFSNVSNATTARVIPVGAISFNWPLVRSAGRFGEQVVEPRVQFVVAPNYGVTQSTLIPNEDSLGLEFTDANLFSLNQFPGIDRFAGGERIDYALQAAWYLPSGAQMSGLIGQSYAFHRNALFPAESGLSDNVSAIVARTEVSPFKWVDLSYRTRLSHHNLGVQMVDTTARFGTPALNFTGGYLYSTTNPYYLYTQAGPMPAAYYIPRREVTIDASTTLVPHWTFSAGAARNIETGQFDYASADATWQNSCTAISIVFYKRYTSYNYDQGSTMLLINVTLKTLGNFGFSTL